MRIQALLLTAAAVALATPAAAGANTGIACSKAAIASLLRREKIELTGETSAAVAASISSIRCADLTGDGRRDVAWSASALGTTGGDTLWGVAYVHRGARRLARFSGQVHYHGLRIRGRGVLIDFRLYRPEDPGCCPRGARRVESAAWNGSRFVRRVDTIGR